MSKIFLIIAAVLTIASAGLGFMNKTKLEDSRAATAEKATELATSKKETADAKTRLEASEKDLAVCKSQTAEAEQVATQARQELGIAQGKVTDLTSQMTAKDTEIEDLKGKIEQFVKVPGTDPLAGTAPVAAPPEQVAELNTKLEAAEQEKILLGEKLQAAQDQMKSLQENEKRRSQGVMARGLQGQILAVNQAWNFVVLSIGDRQGVANNAEMIVRRGGSMIGRLKVTSVEPTTSIADIVPGSTPNGLRVQPGDVVVYPGSNIQTPTAN